MFLVSMRRTGKGDLHELVDAKSVEHVFTQDTVPEHIKFTLADGVTTVEFSLAINGAYHISVSHGTPSIYPRPGDAPTGDRVPTA